MTTIALAGADRCATASRAGARSSTAHKHQTRADAGCASGQSLLAADDTQDWPATLRAGSYVRLVTSDLLPGSISVHLRGRAIAAAPRLSHSVAPRVSSTARLNTLRNQQFSQAVADALHFHRRLSSSLVSVGIDPNERRLTHEAEPLSPDDKIHD